MRVCKIPILLLSWLLPSTDFWCLNTVPAIQLADYQPVTKMQHWDGQFLLAGFEGVMYQNTHPVCTSLQLTVAGLLFHRSLRCVGIWDGRWSPRPWLHCRCTVAPASVIKAVRWLYLYTYDIYWNTYLHQNVSVSWLRRMPCNIWILLYNKPQRNVF